MIKSLCVLFASFFLYGCVVQRPSKIDSADVERIIRTLSADDMQGRATFSLGIESAAKFIEKEFNRIGLQPLNTEKNFRQEFTMATVKPGLQTAVINGDSIPSENIIVLSDQSQIDWSDNNVKVIYIKPGQSFFEQYRKIVQSEETALVLVGEQYADAFKRLREDSRSERIIEKSDEKAAIVFVLTDTAQLSAYKINATNIIENAPLFNIAGMIKGKSRPDEYVIFSGHYDHIGILKANEGDSIANGADDDASGVTAVISLAKYYKKLNSNERTLIFVAFTAEETGGFGSKHFSGKLDPDKMIAMFNIEMIGKDSKFGRNTAFITGYERSDFGEILQRNLEGTAFKFYPDPYPEQNLFYRSDNATLALLGVPAHTISTVQIDKDKFYHTVNDEFETLDVNNIYSTIQAIALSSKSIVDGTDTPKRIPKPQPGNK
ncbi:MAG TPA: M20/M25/M40 family metallo-hydrolase [Sphingobacteriaceae bacterium]|nr:M20/M25/M40 family metallo-hydrolase [Sphingobacteriaceae bacterium]